MTDTEAVVVYRRLAAAIVRRAALDARGGNGHSAEARRWLVSSPWAGDLLDGLDFDRQRVVAWVLSLESGRVSDDAVIRGN